MTNKTLRHVPPSAVRIRFRSAKTAGLVHAARIHAALALVLALPVATGGTTPIRRAADAAPSLAEPALSPDGREIAFASGGDIWSRRPRVFYRGPDGAIMAVTAPLGDGTALSKPRIVVANPPFNQAARSLAMTPDASRFVAWSRGEPPVFTLILDWAEKLK
jgi:hypothetical protein